MKHQHQYEHFNAVNEWFKTDLGRALLKSEKLITDEWVSRLFGYHLLHIGPDVTTRLIEKNLIRHHILLQPDAGEHEPQSRLSRLPALPDALPIRQDSVDVVSLVHTLEYTNDPHDILREAYRVLAPEGHMLIVGFNPVGFWGAWRHARLHKGLPWSGKFLSAHRLKDWLSLLGCDVVKLQYCYFSSPFYDKKIIHKHLSMKNHIQRFLPWSGAVYLILAKKRVSTLTPIRPRWKAKRRIITQELANTSTREGA